MQTHTVTVHNRYETLEKIRHLKQSSLRKALVTTTKERQEKQVGDKWYSQPNEREAKQKYHK